MTNNHEVVGLFVVELQYCMGEHAWCKLFTFSRQMLRVLVLESWMCISTLDKTRPFVELYRVSYWSI